MQVALIELYTSHDECLYSQIRFLKESGYTVHVICNVELRPRVADLDLVDNFYYLHFGAGTWSDFHELLRLRRYLITNNVKIAVLNTARGSRIRNLLLLPHHHSQFVGIGHIANKIFSGFTSRLISLKVKKYFVLNDYILPQLPGRKNIRVTSFYNIYFPPFTTVPLNKPADAFWICIPGGIEFERKDYDSLLLQLSDVRLDPRIKFILLGKSNATRRENQVFMQKINKKGLTDRFILFTDYVKHDEHFSYLAKTDLILPLIHPRKKRYDEYIKYKISGAFNLAFGFQIPMLCEETFRGFDDFVASSFFYTEDQLVTELNSLVYRDEEIKQKSNEIKKYPKFQFDYQKNKYIEFICSKNNP